VVLAASLILSENDVVFKPGLYNVNRELADGINMMNVYSCSASQAEYVDPLDFSKSIPALRMLITEWVSLGLHIRSTVSLALSYQYPSECHAWLLDVFNCFGQAVEQGGERLRHWLTDARCVS